ncbi:MAG: phytanoyl-CoA dioxygenase family protein [Pseudomonadota bacterium]
MSIPQFTAETPTDLIAEGLEEAGCAVVTGCISQEEIANVRTELAPHMARASTAREKTADDFYPGLTRRVTALVARSPTVANTLLTHPVSMDACERFLLPNSEFGYQLHVTAALEIGPGARGQVLHREEDTFTFFPLPRPNLIVASMWAISDFRSDNGATLVVPGSHMWTEDRIAEDHEILPAEMPAGSVFFWLGGLLHGAGANTSDDWRYGVILTYSAGWVRQEENQYLDIPAEQLERLTPEVRKIAGFEMYRALGFSDPTVTADPIG